MADELDPYAELGLERDADDAAVKAAYLKRSKETHPDTGGSEDAYIKVKTAYDVLSDPEKRTKFDHTGTIDPERPDNTRVAALQIIEKFVAPAMNAFVQGGFNPQFDPRRPDRDVLAEIRGQIEAEMAQFHEGAATGAKVLEFFRDLVPRFTAKTEDNFLRRSIERQIRENERVVQNFIDGIVARELAIKLLGDCEFRRDQIFNGLLGFGQT